MLRIKFDPATDMNDITNQVPDASAAQPRHIGTEPVTGLHQRIVDQRGQLDQHLRRLKALLVALNHPQTLLSAIEGSLDAIPSLGRKDRRRSAARRLRL
jgi:hypothetical protein